MIKLPVGISRRVAIAGVTGAVLESPALLSAAGGTGRSVVCLGMSDAADGAGILVERGGLAIRSGRLRYRIHSNLLKVRDLYQSNVVALATPAGERQGDGAAAQANGRAFLNEGFSVPAWMLQAVGASSMETTGRACTFASGVVMMSPNLSSGPQHENPQWSGARAAGFPATPLGAQLSQVAAMIRGGAGPFFYVSLSGQRTVGEAAAQLSARYQELGDALAAFQAALISLGLDRQVVVYSDPGFACEAGADDPSGTQILSGTQVVGGAVYSDLGPSRNVVSAALAEWAGFRADLLFPGVKLPANRFVI